ncbi:MAG: ZIP family metal transporter [Candidatus Omnitrophica bacterium]|nr:ZIP family metal transporter [Candidatus Omnitrophota bacterium]
MLSVWCSTIGSVVVVSLASFIGIVALSKDAARVQRAIFIMVSLAVGAMFGDTFIHLLPEAFKSDGSLATPAYILAGILVFFLLEKFLLWRHEHIPHYGACVHPVGYVSLVADGLHNFIDGLLIGSSYLVSLPVGLATTIAVLLHEIPQEIGDFGVLLHAGFTTAKALWFNFFAASLAIVGAITALIAGELVAAFPKAILPLTAGGFIYLAGSDLVPELHKEREPVKSLIQMLAIGVGIGLMLLVKLFGS